MFTIRNFSDGIRFSGEFHALREFLLKNADGGVNEHFHSGRLEWMMAHSYLETDRVSKSALFYDESGALAGAAVFDTGYCDRWYLLRKKDDEALLCRMVSYAEAEDGENAVFRVNDRDCALERFLFDKGYRKSRTESVLEIGLDKEHEYILPEGIRVLSENRQIDLKEYSRVVHRGFDHEGEPEEPNEEVRKAQKYLMSPHYIKVFTERNMEYLSHTGVWYDGGDTAYIEPVVTVPEWRGKGLGRAAVYEAINRAKRRGAKRAIVLSDQIFYKKLGMMVSSRVGVWERNAKDR